METRYTVRQAVEMTGVKSYVLRYWEEELELRIHRNELGHRYYTGYDIQLFMNIKELKKRGLQLRAIRELIPKLARTAPGSTESRTKLLEGEMVEIPPDKEEVVTEEIIEDPHKDNDEKILEFQTMLERLIAQELKLQNDREDSKSQTFVKAYEAANKDEVPNQFAADTYDVLYAMKAAADAAEITPDMENADISAAMSEAMLSVELDGLTGKAKWTEDGECDKEPKAFEIQDGAYVEMD